MITPTPWKPFRVSLGSVEYMRVGDIVCAICAFFCLASGGCKQRQFTPPPHTHTYTHSLPVLSSAFLHFVHKHVVCVPLNGADRPTVLSVSASAQTHTPAGFFHRSVKYDINRSLFPPPLLVASSCHKYVNQAIVCSYVLVYAFRLRVPSLHTCRIVCSYVLVYAFRLRVPSLHKCRRSCRLFVASKTRHAALFRNACAELDRAFRESNTRP
jgi:hypothetical protein